MGTSHKTTNTPCQDAHAIETLTVNGEELTFIAISDGAGTAIHADRGSSFAVNEWIKLAHDGLISGEAIGEQSLGAWALQVRANLTDLATAEGNSVGDYSCTLLGAIVSNTSAWLFQVGDGAWITRSGEVFEAQTWPFQGEYAGETIFITSAEAERHFQIKLSERIDALAGFTDGLERLALSFSEKAVHGPFFAGMLAALKEREIEVMRPDVEAFLTSDRVIARTDDDKTLVLATAL